MEQIWIFCGAIFLLQLIVSLTVAAETYVTCLSCNDVASPNDCQDSRICGKAEICYTREFTNHKGFLGFNLGCEVETRCNLFLNAATIVGKRNTDPAPPEQCYECCNGNACNGQLCQGKGGAHVPPTHHTLPDCSVCPQTTAASNTTKYQLVSTAACPNAGCPHQWIAYKNRCYFFGAWDYSWDAARTYCKGKGGDLVSINTQDEDQFLVKELDIIAANGSFRYLWTGGSYSLVTHKWEWVDRSSMSYTNWWPGFPGALSHDHDYHIVMMNPEYMSSFKGGNWLPSLDTNIPFICESKRGRKLDYKYLITVHSENSNI